MDKDVTQIQRQQAQQDNTKASRLETRRRNSAAVITCDWNR